MPQPIGILAKFAFGLRREGGDTGNPGYQQEYDQQQPCRDGLHRPALTPTIRALRDIQPPSADRNVLQESFQVALQAVCRGVSPGWIGCNRFPDDGLEVGWNPNSI